MTKAEKAPTRIQQKNRAAIMAAGLDIFAQFGFRGATLDQIAEAAGMSKPNLLYYFPSKEAIYTAILEKQLETWLDPLRALNAKGDPIEEILSYTMRKLDMSRDTPRESRLFANEILQGAPRISEHLSGPLRDLVDEKAQVISDWSNSKRIAKVDPHHLIFTIWATTQHYADFDVQVRAVTGKSDVFDDARAHLQSLITSLLKG